MPELPEVETVCRGARPLLLERRLDGVEFRRRDLRWPIPVAAVRRLVGRSCCGVERRSKYMLLRFDGGGADTAVVHLGMSGRFFVDVVANDGVPDWRTHEHWRMRFQDHLVRYVDPRRFGCLDVARGDALHEHRLLRELGVEPLEDAFDAGFLHQVSRRRKVSVKSLLMDAKVVVGVGNIYASEACHRAGVRPRRAAGSLTRGQAAALCDAVRHVLRSAIDAGGTSFRDYVGVDEDAGYFARELRVYERAGQRCLRCGCTIRRAVDHGRSTYWCSGCQR